MSEYKETMEVYRSAVEEYLENCFADQSCPQRELFQAMRYSLLAGGKRIRPVLTLEYSRERLSSASQRLMQAKREQFVRLTAKLDAMSPLKVLSRGYSVVRTEDGSVLRRAADARLGDRIQIDLMQGTLLAEVSQVLEAEDA